MYFNIWFLLFFVANCSIGIGKASAAEQTVCKTNPLYCKITKANRQIEPSFAMLLSNKINEKAKLNKINPKLAVAILLQESHFNKVNTYKTKKEYKEFCNKDNCYKVSTEIEEAFDLSFAQINISTAKQYDLDVERLYKNDVEYVLDSFFLILKDKMRLCSDLGTESFTCYHNRNEPYRSIYLDLVSKYL